ncbi:MAG: hypothetical protein IIW42_05420 [Bacteroidaceae bacterium]|nr:hypothetical protein [Bacteroidaceae bacterium]
MANEFSNTQKVKMIATEVADKCPYLKEATSYMTQGQLEGKKYGRTYKVYIPDPGKVVDGLDADPADINEVEVPVTLENKNTSFEVNVWNKLTDIEDFKKEIVKPKAVLLAQSLDKAAIDKTVFNAAQAVVGSANFATLSDASMALDEAKVAGTKVCFVKPTVAGKIANGGLANFIPDDIQRDIYRENYLGQYAGAAVINEANLPVVDATNISAAAASVTLTDVSGKGFEPITSVSGTGLKAGWAFTADGLKVVGKDGIQTDQDYAIIVDKDGKIPELRITVDGEAFGNPNAWVASGTSALTLSPILTEGKKYYVGQVRTQKALGVDTYKFDDLPGSENATETVDGISIKMSQYGDGNHMKVLGRLDAPHAFTLPEQREAVTVYFEK